MNIKIDENIDLLQVWHNDEVCPPKGMRYYLKDFRFFLWIFKNITTLIFS